MVRKQIVQMLLAGTSLVGCGVNGNDGPQALTPQSFYDTRSIPGPEEPNQGIDRGGAIVRNPLPVEATTPPPPQPVTRTPTAVSTAPPPPMVEVTDMPATQPSGTNAQYLTAGAVVVTVSGKPIYADQVLRALTPLLSQAARDLNPAAFRIEARNQIQQQVTTMIMSELQYATAQVNLSNDDKQRAETATMIYRQKLRTEAGGSDERARQRAQSEGISLDEKVNDYYRGVLWELYYIKFILSRSQVTAEDMRAYYEKNLNEFTENEQVKFRLIKITAAATGGREPAIDKIGGLRNKLANASAEEFAKEASEVNDDRALKQSGGQIGTADGWLSRGSFAVKEVEDAVWKLQPGQMTEVIEVNNAFYLARLEDRKPGRVRLFDDQQVQIQIKEKLRKPQIDARIRQLQQRLLREAVIYPEQPLIEPVLDMATQKYNDWRASAS